MRDVQELKEVIKIMKNMPVMTSGELRSRVMRKMGGRMRESHFRTALLLMVNSCKG